MGSTLPFRQTGCFGKSALSSGEDILDGTCGSPFHYFSGRHFFLYTHQKSVHNILCLMEQGEMDKFPDRPCTALASNFGHRPVHLPMNTLVGLALLSLASIFSLGP